MKDYRISVRLSPDMRKRLKAAARRSGKRESDLVRRAVERELAADDEDRTLYDEFNEAGLIGIVKGAPPDLSTNKKYFEGFGRS